MENSITYFMGCQGTDEWQIKACNIVPGLKKRKKWFLSFQLLFLENGIFSYAQFPTKETRSPLTCYTE